MSSVLVPCLIKLIHLQGHIPYVLCAAAPAISGNSELKTAEKATADGKDYRKETLCNSKRSCYQGKRPSTKTSRNFLPALWMPTLMKPAGRQARFGRAPEKEAAAVTG